MKKDFRVYILISLVSVLTLAVVITVAFAGGMILGQYFENPAQAASITANKSDSAPQLSQSAEFDSDDVLGAYENALTDLYQTVVPSVVDIQVTQKIEAAGQSFGGDPNSPFNRFHQDTPEDFYSQGQGSGFVWDEEGHIVTNYHVVENADTVEVIFEDGTSAAAEVLGIDPDSDLAVLYVDLSAADLQPLALADSDTLKPGQLAFAIGMPLGQDFSMTSGIVSAVNRTIQSGSSLFSIPEVIQTDAPINPGNSGGPLFDRFGNVIGINTMILSQSGTNAGIGFAVPINIAKQVVPTLIEGETYEYAWLGITGSTLQQESVTLMDLPADTQGAQVIDVAEDGPADQAGLQGATETDTLNGIEYPIGGDIITAINGQPVEGMDTLITYLVEETRPGDQITLDLIRNGDREEVSVTLGSRPQNP